MHRFISPPHPGHPPRRFDRRGATTTARLGLFTYLAMTAWGVLTPRGTAIGTFKYNVGAALVGTRHPLSQRMLAGEQLTTAGDHTINLAMLLPLTFLACFAFPKVRWWWWGVGATLLGAASETAQWLLPLGRRALVSNAVENAAGGWLGVALAMMARRPHTSDGQEIT